MNVKSKAYDYLQILLDEDGFHLTSAQYRMILLALIENGAVHADEIWIAEKLIEAYEEVMGEYHTTDCDCVDCCDHPTCGTTGVCVNHCDECNGECEVLE